MGRGRIRTTPAFVGAAPEQAWFGCLAGLVATGSRAAGHCLPRIAVILVLVPHGFPVPAALWERCAVVPYGSAADAVAALAQASAAAVVVSDALEEPSVGVVAAAVRAAGKPVIEVRSERWDGQTFSPLSAACRGVISGFGADGISTAVAALEG